MGLLKKLFAPENQQPTEPPPAVNGSVNGTAKHLRSALVQAYGDQVAKLASMPTVHGFVESHLRDDVMRDRLLYEAQQCLQEVEDRGEALRVSYREHETLLVRIDVLPVSSKDAAEWFTREHGSYLDFQAGVVDDPGFRRDGYKVFFHVVFGVEKRLANGVTFAWSSIGLMPVWEPNLTEWVCPRVCCNEDDRAVLGF